VKDLIRSVQAAALQSQQSEEIHRCWVGVVHLPLGFRGRQCLPPHPHHYRQVNNDVTISAAHNLANQALKTGITYNTKVGAFCWMARLRDVLHAQAAVVYTHRQGGQQLGGTTTLQHQNSSRGSSNLFFPLPARATDWQQEDHPEAQPPQQGQHHHGGGGHPGGAQQADGGGVQQERGARSGALEEGGGRSGGGWTGGVCLQLPVSARCTPLAPLSPTPPAPHPPTHPPHPPTDHQRQAGAG